MNDRSGAMQRSDRPGIGSRPTAAEARTMLGAGFFVLTLVTACASWAAFFLIAMFIAPKYLEVERDFGNTTVSSLTKLAMQVTAWLTAKSPGQSLPGAYLAIPVTVAAMVGIGVVGSRVRTAGIFLAAMATLVGFAAVLALFFGLYDSAVSLSNMGNGR